jgi:nucleoid DNA-binding protein
MAGFTKLVSSLKPKCPHCKRAFDASHLVNALFELVVKELEKGERVKVKGFGVFYTITAKGREIISLGGVPKYLKSRKQLRFKVSHNLRKRLRESKDHNDTD